MITIEYINVVLINRLLINKMYSEHISINKARRLAMIV